MSLAYVFDRFAVGVVETFGQNDLYFGQQIARLCAFSFHAVAFDSEFGPAGCCGRDLQRYGSFRRGYVDLGAQGGLGQRDGHTDLQVIAVAMEELVGRDVDSEDNIAGSIAGRRGLALAAKAYFFAAIDTGRNAYGDRLVLARVALHGELHLAAFDGRLEGDGQVVGDVHASLASFPSTTLLPARARLGELAEEIGEAAPARTSRTARTARPGSTVRCALGTESFAEKLAEVDILGIETTLSAARSAWSGARPATAPSTGTLRSLGTHRFEGTAIAVVKVAFFLIVKHIEGGLNLLELLGRRVVVGVDVRVVLSGHFAVCILNIRLRCVAANTQRFVIIFTHIVAFPAR